jgi:hypothetical protein
MTRYHLDTGIPTLAVALAEHMNADELKMLATLTKARAPARKAELVEHILTYLDGDRLPTVWQGLDDLQKAAVAEVVDRLRQRRVAVEHLGHPDPRKPPAEVAHAAQVIGCRWVRMIRDGRGHPRSSR